MAGAVDKTPYNLSSVGTYRGDSTITWMVEHMDLFTHYRNVGAAVYDSVLDSAETLNPDFKAGFYGSSQEINALIYDLPSWNTQYAERIADTDEVWFYLLIDHYFDSIGVSVDSCCLNWLDTAWQTTNDGRGDTRTRIVDRADTLVYKKTRVSYQTFDNDADDTAFYPAGYAWFANGKNADTRRAIAYAFRRRTFESSIRQAVEGGDYGPMNYIFMDNQYKNAGFLGSYWTVNSTAGGPTAGADFSCGYTNVNIETGGATYFLESTCMIDSVLKWVLDSTAAANGYDSVETFANVDWADSGRALAPAKYVSGIFFEGALQPDRTAGLWNTQWKISAGLILDKNTTYANYMNYGNFASYFTEGQDRADMAHYCFYLVVQNYNEGRFWTYWHGSSTLDWGSSWHDVLLVDLGYPEPDTAKNAYYGGTGWYGDTPYRWVKRRTYLSAAGTDTTAVVLFGSTAGTTYNWNTDSIKINLQDGNNKIWYEVEIDGDTAIVGDSVFYVKPYQGKILLAEQGTPEAPPIMSDMGPVTATQNLLDSVYCTATGGTGDSLIDSVDCYVWTPASDSVDVGDTILVPAQAIVDFTFPYTFPDTGSYIIVFVGVNVLDQVGRDSVTCVVSAAPAADSNKIHFGNGIHFNNGIEVK